ncbi:MAG: hypothetical protein Q8K98_08985 [Bacteroidota bacterium]|nr:hypothetical protein [Bacteroidota bacterium]
MNIKLLNARNTLILILSFIFSASNLIGGKSVPIVPIQGNSISILINDKEKTYYSLTKTNHIKVKVNGPGKLQVITRLTLPKHQTLPEKYTIKVIEGSETVKLYSTSSERSEAVIKNSEFIPGKSRKFTLSVPEGTHTYEYYLENTQINEASLKFNLVTRKGFKKGRGVTLEPLSYDRVVTATVKENLITYYVSSKKTNVQLRVVGSTRVKVTARLNFDATMKGKQSYVIAVFEGSKHTLMKQLSTTKSLGIIYQEWKDVVPGKTDTFYIDVVEGEHIYKFSLEETSAHSVSLKFSIPSKDLNNER